MREYERSRANMTTAGMDITVARLRKQSRHRRLNGRTSGRASTHSVAAGTSTA